MQLRCQLLCRNINREEAGHVKKHAETFCAHKAHRHDRERTCGHLRRAVALSESLCGSQDLGRASRGAPSAAGCRSSITSGLLLPCTPGGPPGGCRSALILQLTSASGRVAACGVAAWGCGGLRLFLHLPWRAVSRVQSRLHWIQTGAGTAYSSCKTLADFRASPN